VVLEFCNFCFQVRQPVMLLLASHGLVVPTHLAIMRGGCDRNRELGGDRLAVSDGGAEDGRVEASEVRDHP
jgi:hypothetical protein